MSQPTPLWERQTHVVLQVEGGDQHVYPVVYFRAWLAEQPGTDDIPGPVLKAIVQDWLDRVTWEDTRSVRNRNGW